MDHIAIMNSSWKLLPKILSGEKTIESRWYITRRAPWDKIDARDTVYFKDSGKPIIARANVSRVVQFENLNPEQINRILDKYYKRLGIDSPKEYFKAIKNRRYCILIFLENVEQVEPFNIDKSGFGTMSAWISIDKVDSIKA